MSRTTRLAINWIEQGLVPDTVVRAGIRRLCEQRLKEIAAADCEPAAQATEAFVRSMDASEIAPLPNLANEQHYELPPEFFALALGPHRKYSSACWPEGTTSLADAEANALGATCEHAELADGRSILEPGCGWGSLTLWMAEGFPTSRITAVSNSRSQRAWILGEARRRGLGNVELITADMNQFDAGSARFDRAVAVEMFEHMRNWMSRQFFAGGMMPSDELALRFQDALRFLRRWRWNGRHYEKTANAWLANVDARRAAVLPVLAATYGDAGAEQWLQRWRIFFMACAELFGHRNGQEWWVSHYLFERPAR